MAEFSIYCDESCHLPHDQCDAMVLGALWMPNDEIKRISKQIRLIKNAHGLPSQFEIKWVKVSPARLDFYKDLINYYFDEHFLNFRALIVPDKKLLDHERFQQTHDDWYYKMFFTLLTQLISPRNKYHIYLDYKDTQGGIEVRKMQNVLCKSILDFDAEIIQKVQIVRSNESEQIQLTDLMIGLLAYKSRNLQTSSAKLTLVDLFKERSGYSLTKSTLVQEEKTNLFFWRAK